MNVRNRAHSNGEKIQQLHGPMTPKTFCGVLVENADKIKHIACVVQWDDDDDSTTVHSTQMTEANLAWLKHVFNEDLFD